MDYAWVDTGTSTTGSSGFIRLSNTLGQSVEAKKESGMPAQIFFKLMKKKMGILADMSYKRRMKKLQELADKATEDGQIALSEEIVKRFLVLSCEAELYAIGKRIFLNKTIFDKFKRKSRRTVCLTSLDNYARIIPEDVLQEKKKMDKLKIFSEYVVMHYDSPDSVKETEVEVVKREKDPILFGRIEYSDKLYFVADWEDEFCDLTLDDIVNKLELEDEDITLPKKPTL